MSVCRNCLRLASISLFFVFVFNVCTASAGIIVSVGNAAVPQGQSTVVDILVHSGAIGGEALSSFNAEFRVTPELGVGSVLEIASVPDISGESNYVFADSSSGFSGNVLGPPYDVAVVGDFGFAIVDDTPLLLARLLLSPGLGTLAPSEGDSFRIELVPLAGDSFDFLLGTSNTGFLNLDFDLDFNPILEPIAFESSVGIVEVTGNVVPEPDAAIVWMIGFAMIGLLPRLRRWGSLRGRSSCDSSGLK